VTHLAEVGLLAGLPLTLVACYHLMGVLHRGPWILLASQAAWWAGLAILQSVFHAPWYAFPDGVAAAVFGHAAWEVWRRRRKPRSERATGRVVDLGHRLAVVAEVKR
jgi:hypothetical protein